MVLYLRKPEEAESGFLIGWSRRYTHSSRPSSRCGQIIDRVVDIYRVD